MSDTKNIEVLKQQFYDIVRSEIRRDGIDSLVKYLESRDFFVAPASTKYHNAFDGGLLDHSINVYDALLRINEQFGLKLDAESMAIVALFHDVCKVDTYVKGKRNVKNQYGTWESKDVWERREMLPLGHGEKSAIIIDRYIRLKLSEVYAIRWHMGGFDSAVKGGDGSMNAAFEKCPLAAALHMADLAATYLMEGKENVAE